MSGPTFQSPEDNAAEPVAVELAQRVILAAMSPVSTEQLLLDQVSGRVLRQDIVAVRDLPEADNSAMDGYAVRSEDVRHATPSSAVTLEVVIDLPAGHLPEAFELTSGSAARIMTGGFLPRGADAVIPVERTDAGSDRVQVFRSVRPGENIRPRGEDITAGARVLREGRIIGSGELLVLASMRRTSVRVSRRPRVSIIPTGDELAEIDAPLTPGKIVNSSAWGLRALVEEAGGEAVVHPIVGDDLDATRDALQKALETDLVITTGGVSVGAFDFVKRALAELGAERLLWRVRMKPGKPLLFSTLGGKPVFGLPGNPVSSMVSFHLFVGPAIRAMLGVEGSPLPLEVLATLEDGVNGAEGRESFHRVDVSSREGRLFARPMKKQGSGVGSSMAGANGLARCAEGVQLRAGELARIVVIGRIGSADAPPEDLSATEGRH